MLDCVLHTIVEAPEYLAAARQAGMTDGERHEVISVLAGTLTTGDVIRGTGRARKMRFAGCGKGKSGGYRVITYFAGDDMPLFLLTVFSKGERPDLSQADRNDLQTVLGELAAVYRRGARSR